MQLRGIKPRLFRKPQGSGGKGAYFAGGVSPSALWQFGCGKDQAAWLAALRRGDCAQVNDRTGCIACERSPCCGAWRGCAKMSEYVENRGCVGGPTPSAGPFFAPSGDPAQNRMIGGAKKNVKNEAKCEMRNMNSDEGLSQDGSIAGRKTKPPIRATAQCSLPDADVPTGWTHLVVRDRSVGTATPVLRRRRGWPTRRPDVPSCERNVESGKTKPKVYQVRAPFPMGGTTAGCTVAMPASATFGLVIAVPR